MPSREGTAGEFVGTLTVNGRVVLDNLPYGPKRDAPHRWVLNGPICCGEGCDGRTCTTPGCPCASDPLR